MATDDYLVYKHTAPSGKVYIGITNDYSRRCREHQSKARTGSTFAFHRAIRKYGWENFKHEILTTDLTRQQAADMEVALIAAFPPDQTYNMTIGGEGVDSESSRKGQITNRKDSVKGYSYDKQANKYLVSLRYLGKQLNFGYYKLESEAASRANYLFGLSDGELLKEFDAFKAKSKVRAKGYTFDKKANKYAVQLTVDGRSKFLGYYLTEQEAINRVAQLRKE